MKDEGRTKKELLAELAELRARTEELEAVAAERKQVQRALAAETERLAVTLRSIGDAVIAADTEGRVMLLNEVAEYLTGWRQAEALGKPLPEIFHIVNEATREPCQDPVAKVLESGLVIGLANDTMLIARDGTERIVADSAAPIRDDEGNVIGVVMVFRDITERRRMLDQVVQQSAVLNAINQVFQGTLTCETEEEVARVCLAAAEKLTGSKFGFMCEVNEKGLFDTIAISDPGWEACQIAKADAQKELKDLEIRGIRGAVIREGRAMIFNDPSSDPEWVEPPEGHPAIASFLGVPLRQADKTVGMIGLGNKDSGYRPEDQQAIEALSLAFMEALAHKRAQLEFHGHREHLESLVEKRTAERSRLIDILEATTDFVSFSDPHRHLLYVNRAYREAIGIEEGEDIRQIKVTDLYPEWAAQRIMEEGVPAALREGVWRGDTAALTRDGREIPVSQLILVHRSPDGEVRFLSTIMRDVSEQKWVEQELAWEAGVNRAIAELAAALLAARPLDEIASLVLTHARQLTDSEFGYVGYLDPTTGALTSPAVTPEVLNVRPGDEPEAGAWDWIMESPAPLLINRPADDPRWKGSPAGYVSLRRFLSAPAVVADTALGQIWVANAPVDYDDRDLEVVSRLATIYAVAVQRRWADEELRLKSDELERSNQDLEQFAYVASHDLQEPLRMVRSYVQLLQRRYGGKLDTDADEFIAFAVDGVERMQTLISDLLKLSRVGTRGKEFVPIFCEEVLDQALSNLEIAIRESGASITRDPLPTLRGDDTQLIQLFQNLIGNALKFSGDRRPEIHIAAKPRGRGWMFSVRDNGIGIDPKQAERVFLVFQRLHTREEYPGTGIGLAVCKKIVERHGGRIWVESAAGQGSVFCFTIVESWKPNQT